MPTEEDESRSATMAFPYVDCEYKPRKINIRDVYRCNGYSDELRGHTRSQSDMRQSQTLLNTPGSADRCTLRVQTGFTLLPNHYANYRKPTSSVLVCDEARAGLIPSLACFFQDCGLLKFPVYLCFPLKNALTFYYSWGII